MEPNTNKEDGAANIQTAVADESHTETIQIDDHHFFLHKSALAYCAVACLGGMQFGLDNGAIAGLQAMPGFLMIFGFRDPNLVIGYNIDPKVQQLISSLLSLGAFASCMLIGPMARYIGRKKSLLIGIVLNHAAVILMIAAHDVSTLYAGRFIMGLGNGLLNALPQLYIHECSSPSQRAPLFALFNISTTFGGLVGAIVDNYCSTIMSATAYRIPLGIFFLFPTLLGIGLIFMPETPRWLIEHGQREKARRSLVKLRNKETSPHMIDAEIQEIAVALEKERADTQGITLFALFRKANIRRTLLSISLVFSLAGTGCLFFLIYSTYFFAIAGQTAAFQESCGITAVGLVGTSISMYLITRVGRRTILLWGMALQALCMLIIAVVYQTHPKSKEAGSAMVAFVILFMATYYVCTGPYLYLVAGEIPSQRLRGYTVGFAIAAGFLGNWLVSYTAPYFINPLSLNWGPKYSYIWFGSNAIIFVFIFFLVPETKDRTLEEIDEMFEDGLPARRFKGHVCIRTNDARKTGLHLVDKKGDKEDVSVAHLEDSKPTEL